MVNESSFSKFAYPDLTIAPYLIATNLQLRVSCLSDVLFNYRRHKESSTPQSENPIKKIQTIRNISNTNKLTYSILQEVIIDNYLSNRVSKRYKNILLEYVYLEDVYASSKLRSIFNFLRLTPYFIGQGYFVKELIRISLSLLIGPSNLLKMELARQNSLTSNTANQRSNF